MSIPSRCLAILLCAALPTHAQSTAKKTPAKVAPKAAPANNDKTAPARTTAQGEVSPLPAPDVEFASPVIAPARAANQAAPAQTAAATTEMEGDLAQFLSGKLVPLDIKLSEMKTGWQSLRVVDMSDDKNEEENRLALVDPGFLGPLSVHFGSTNNRYFTQGRTVRFNNDVHLIVYQAQFPAYDQAQKRIDVYKKGKPNITEGVMNLEAVLDMARSFLATIPVRASLLNTRNISAMKDVETFDFESQFRKLSTDLSAEREKSIARREKSHDTSIENNLKQIFYGAMLYSQNNDEKLPPMNDLPTARQAIVSYGRDKSVWMDDLKITLHPNALLSGKPLAHLKPYASSMVLFYSDADAKGERWILRLDGQVRRVSAAQWPQLKIAARIP